MDTETKAFVRERPILFSGSMVRAILEGPKTQTRRPVKDQPPSIARFNYSGGRLFHVEKWPKAGREFSNFGRVEDVLCPYGQPGDRLWVKETFQTGEFAQNEPRGFVYRATDPDWETVEGWKWKPSIYMPRAASRIDLELNSVRVERLQDISEADAMAEGCEMAGDFPKEQLDKSGIGSMGWDDAREWYSWLWEEINGIGSWEKNPWVWVLEFKRLEIQTHGH